MNWTRLANTQHRYLVHDGTLYIWCAGTHGWSQWAHNVDTRTMRYAGRRVNTRDYAEASYIIVELASSGTIHRAKEIVTCGFSRGGAAAQILALMIDSGFRVRTQLHLFASKRTMTRVSDIETEANRAHRGDPVPYLPPWPYRLPPVDWQRKITWPWKAHNRAAHDAARWRHDMTKGGRQ